MNGFKKLIEKIFDFGASDIVDEEEKTDEQWENDYNYVENYIRNNKVPTEKDVIIQFLISKTEEWQYEKEWRFIYMNDDVMVKDKECDEVHANIVKRMEVSGNNIFNFIKPTRIIFGWNNYSDSENNRFYDDLNDWASRNNIECIYLDNKIDYKDMTFHKREQRVP